MKYIYGLVDPDDRSIRYVGQTTNLNRRHIEHVESNERTPKGKWVQQLREQGKQPDIVCLEVVQKGIDPNVREKWWLTLIEDHFYELVNKGNPSAKPVSFGDMFSERLQDEYDIFVAALKSQEPLVIITRTHMILFVLLLKILAAIILGATIGFSAWNFHYAIKGELIASVFTATTMGLGSGFMFLVALTRKFKNVWFVHLYCGAYFLFGLYSIFWGQP